MISDSLQWDDHTDNTPKAAKRLWFLKKLRWAGVSVHDLVRYYQTVVRPVLEYACPVWRSSLSKQQANCWRTFNAELCRLIINKFCASDNLCRVIYSRQWLTWIFALTFFLCILLRASLYVSKRGAYWDRLCRDVVGRWLVGRWLSRACTVAKRCILCL